MSTKNKEPTLNGPKMGKSTGYTVSDGGNKITLAPIHRDDFDRLICEREGVAQLVQDVSKFAQARHSEITAKFQALWRSIADDIGISITDNWGYMNGDIVRKAPEPALLTAEPVRAKGER